MCGAIIGDIAGSTYERDNFKFVCCHIFEEGSQVTDDTVLTLRTADHIEEKFSYNLHRTLAEIRPGYRFDVSCDGLVPEAIIAFLESSNQPAHSSIWTSTAPRTHRRTRRGRATPTSRLVGNLNRMMNLTPVIDARAPLLGVHALCGARMK
jgi:hypothetical protein